MRRTYVITIATLLPFVFAEAASAANCSSWRAVCVKRATSVNPNYLPQCDAKFSVCLSSGCFSESARFGGATHCGLTRK